MFWIFPNLLSITAVRIGKNDLVTLEPGAVFTLHSREAGILDGGFQAVVKKDSNITIRKSFFSNKLSSLTGMMPFYTHTVRLDEEINLIALENSGEIYATSVTADSICITTNERTKFTYRRVEHFYKPGNIFLPLEYRTFKIDTSGLIQSPTECKCKVNFPTDYQHPKGKKAFSTDVHFSNSFIENGSVLQIRSGESRRMVFVTRPFEHKPDDENNQMVDSEAAGFCNPAFKDFTTVNQNSPSILTRGDIETHQRSSICENLKMPIQSENRYFTKSVLSNLWKSTFSRRTRHWQGKHRLLENDFTEFEQ